MNKLETFLALTPLVGVLAGGCKKPEDLSAISGASCVSIFQGALADSDDASDYTDSDLQMTQTYGSEPANVNGDGQNGFVTQWNIDGLDELDVNVNDLLNNGEIKALWFVGKDVEDVDASTVSDMQLGTDSGFNDNGNTPLAEELDGLSYLYAFASSLVDVNGDSIERDVISISFLTNGCETVVPNADGNTSTSFNVDSDGFVRNY